MNLLISDFRQTYLFVTKYIFQHENWSNNINSLDKESETLSINNYIRSDLKTFSNEILTPDFFDLLEKKKDDKTKILDENLKLDTITNLKEVTVEHASAILIAFKKGETWRFQELKNPDLIKITFCLQRILANTDYDCGIIDGVLTQNGKTHHQLKTLQIYLKTLKIPNIKEEEIGSNGIPNAKFLEAIVWAQFNGYFSRSVVAQEKETPNDIESDILEDKAIIKTEISKIENILKKYPEFNNFEYRNFKPVGKVITVRTILNNNVIPILEKNEDYAKGSTSRYRNSRFIYRENLCTASGTVTNLRKKLEKRAGIPETPVLAAPEPVTPEPVTPEPVTPEPVTPAPETTVPETTVPETTVPETTVPETPEPVTPEPVTPEPVTPEPVTPEPVTPESAELNSTLQPKAFEKMKAILTQYLGLDVKSLSDKSTYKELKVALKENYPDDRFLKLRTPSEYQESQELLDSSSKNFEIKEDGDILTIKIDVLTRGIAQKLKTALTGKSPQKIILDLQNSPGGKPMEALLISTMLTGKSQEISLTCKTEKMKKILMIKYKNRIKNNNFGDYIKVEKDTVNNFKLKLVTTAPDSKIFPTKTKIAILVNNKTASAAEILGQTLADEANVSVFGQATHNKPDYQDTMSLYPKNTKRNKTDAEKEKIREEMKLYGALTYTVAKWDHDDDLKTSVKIKPDEETATEAESKNKATEWLNPTEKKETALELNEFQKRVHDGVDRLPYFKISDYLGNKIKLENTIKTKNYPPTIFIQPVKEFYVEKLDDYKKLTADKYNHDDIRKFSKMIQEIYKDKEPPFIMMDNEHGSVQKAESYPEPFDRLKIAFDDMAKLMSTDGEKLMSIYKIEKLKEGKLSLGDISKLKFPEDEEFFKLYAEIRVLQEKSLGLNTVMAVLGEGVKKSLMEERGLKTNHYRIQFGKYLCEFAKKHDMAVVFKHWPGLGRLGKTDTHDEKVKTQVMTEIDDELWAFHEVLNYNECYVKAQVFVMTAHVPMSSGNEFDTDDDGDGIYYPASQSSKVANYLKNKFGVAVITDDTRSMKGFGKNETERAKGRKKAKASGQLVLQ